MGQTALSVTSRTYGGCLERCGLGLNSGREGTASALVATAKAPAPCVSVTWSTLGALASRRAEALTFARLLSKLGIATEPIKSPGRPGVGLGWMPPTA